ncbi:hypothetical protein E2C01_098543 [Portunus trituberculatus]|uniref:Uncharacterized protein n=1 Tax=Portunus trituberculatus TaxID=210409 RepID=A0A5B7K8J2_PORTR|nr:hypothetical protein [Portunus trituberculatus]
MGMVRARPCRQNQHATTGSLVRPSQLRDQGFRASVNQLFPSAGVLGRAGV